MLRFISDASEEQQGFSITITCDAEAPETTAISQYYAPTTSCTDLPLTGAYAEEECEMYMGGSFSMLGETFVEDPEGKCSIDEFGLSCYFCGQLSEI